MPHAETHAIILAHSVAYNAAATPEGTARLADALGAPDAARGIFDLLKIVGTPTALKDLGFKEDDIADAARITLEKPFHNAEPVTEERLTALLTNAFHGNVPQAID